MRLLAAVIALVTLVVFFGRIPSGTAWRAPPLPPVDLPVDLEARPAALSVQVLSESGQPVLGATVSVHWADGDRYRLAGTGRTAANGHVRIADLPAGAVWVLGSAPGLSRRSTSLALIAGERPLSLRLPPGAQLRVTVRDEAGAAVEGATVLIEESDALPFAAIADGKGLATLTGLGPPPHRVRVLARGYEPEIRSEVASDLSVVLRKTSALEVRVVDAAGMAVKRAVVSVAGPSLFPPVRVETGPDGVAKLGGLPTGGVALRAEEGGRVSRVELGVQVEAGAVRRVTLTLLPGRTIPVVVTDGEGDSPVLVAGADVVLVEGGVGVFPLRGRTGTFGKVVLGPIADGPATVSATAQDFVATPAVVVPEPLEGELRVALKRGATLGGEVVDAQGRPVEGAAIEVVGTRTDGMPIAETPFSSEARRAHFAWSLVLPSTLIPAGELGILSGPIPAIPGALEAPPAPIVPPLFDEGARPPGAWNTRADGMFRASPVPAGRVRALVRHAAYVESASDMVTLTPGGTARVRVVLRTGGSLEGRVVDEAGAPVAATRVDVAATRGTLTKTVFTAEDGTFAFSALPEEVLLSVHRPGRPTLAILRRELTVAEGPPVRVEVALPAERETLEVEVEDDAHRPVALVQVTVLGLDPERPLRATKFTDEQGRARVEDAVGAPLRVVVEAPGFGRTAVETDRAVSPLRVTLTRGVMIEGRVTAVRGRREVEGASVELLSEGRRRVAFTDVRGLYRFEDVTPGAVRLTVSHAELATVEVAVTAEATGRAERPFEVPPIDLAEPGIVEGRVVDSGGKPAPFARIAVGIVGAYVPAGAEPSSVSSAADGTFKLASVAPGSVVLSAVLAGVGSGRSPPLSVQAGRTTGDVEIRLEAEGEARDSAATGGVAITLSEGTDGGALRVVVSEVAKGSEAEHAGLAAGDVVLAVDRVKPASIADVRRRLEGPEGVDVVLELARGDATLSLRVRRERVRR